MYVVAIVPARKGSKGLPRKNMAMVCGKPLVVHAVSACLASDVVDHVIVSTDWDDVASALKQYTVDTRLSVCFRPAGLATDEASVLDVIDYHVREIEREPDVVVLVQPTTPFVRERDVTGMVYRVANGDGTAVLVTQFNGIVWGEESGMLSQCEPRRRQDREKQFIECGCYAWRWPRKEQGTYSGQIALVTIPRWRGIDIDDEVDYYTACALGEVYR